MDIGDPSEIPARRKPLPSMQELGAFELDGGGPSSADSDSGRAAAPAATRRPDAGRAVTRPAPLTEATAAAVSSPAGSAGLNSAPGTSEVAGSPRPPAATLPNLTPEQLRQALAKADPGTRQKLLSLIVGGRPIQRGGAGLEIKPGARRAEPPPAARAGPSTRGTGPAPRAAHPAGASAARSGPAPLLKIDDNTDLLDAAAAPAAAPQRKATMQAQLDAVLQPQDRSRTETAAPKVIFPAYDPTRHGEDVRSTARRRQDGPVEGHFPAPRQPLRSSYQHPDGKPMTPEESKVEEVLQAQRCEETLTVLARDGVNGLLLSPRDLDAAVASGLLDAATAATLWKTWSALRPVIHVIEDEPPEAPPEPADTSAASLEPGDTAERPPAPGPVADAAEASPAVPPVVSPASPPIASAPLPVDRPAVVAKPAAATAPAPVPLPAPAAAMQAPLPSPAPAWAATPDPAPALQPPQGSPAPRGRWRRALRWALLAFVAYAAISTAWQLGRELWYTGWGWMLLDWLQGFRH